MDPWGPETLSIDLGLKRAPRGEILIEIRPILTHFIRFFVGTEKSAIYGVGTPYHHDPEISVYEGNFPFLKFPGGGGGG